MLIPDFFFLKTKSLILVFFSPLVGLILFSLCHFVEFWSQQKEKCYLFKKLKMSKCLWLKCRRSKTIHLLTILQFLLTWCFCVSPITLPLPHPQGGAWGGGGGVSGQKQKPKQRYVQHGVGGAIWWLHPVSQSCSPFPAKTNTKKESVAAWVSTTTVQSTGRYKDYGPNLNNYRKQEPTSAFHIDLYYIINNLILSPKTWKGPRTNKKKNITKNFHSFVHFVSSFREIFCGETQREKTVWCWW